MAADLEDVEQWLRWGYERGWCGPPVCGPHDGLPLTEDEDEDPDQCWHIIRLYADDDEKNNVEDNHSPSVWRASNRGWKGDT